MIDDFQVLGIEETSDLAVIKSAYRRKMKELHPDLAEEGESFRTHLLFIAVSAAYKRLIGAWTAGTSVASQGASAASAGTTAAPESAQSAGPARGGARTGALAVHSDQAYVFYRTGMNYFMKIHPSQWNPKAKRRVNSKIAGKDEDQEAVRRKVMDLVKLFPKAYYYFSIVVHEYPDSVWAYDAAVKTKLIEDRTKRYRHIVESFSAWNKIREGKQWRYDAIRAAEAELRKKIDPETEKKWKE